MTSPAPESGKRSWPLLTLAGTSFIPGFGFFLGAAAVTWGLLSDRPRARLAIWIGAAGALFQIVGGAILVWVLWDNPAMAEARTATVTTDLARIAVELEAYRHDTGRYPATLKELVGEPIPRIMININDHSANLLGLSPYQYRLTRDGRSYELFAVGPDGKPGTSDDIHPPPAGALDTIATATDSAPAN